MIRTILAIAAFSGLAAAQAQIALYDYLNDSLSTPQPSFATVSDLSVSNTYQFGGGTDRWLCLTTDWNDDGGIVSFTVTPNAGEAIDYSMLTWSSDTGNASLSDSVSSVEIYANNVLIGGVDPITHNTVHNLDMTSIAFLQHNDAAVTFELRFTGNPTGQSSYESDFMKLYGKRCELEIEDVTPGSIDTVTRDCFEVTGDCFSQVTGVCFGANDLTPSAPGDFGKGSYTIIDDQTIEVCPPLCLEPGNYDIKLTRSNGEQDTHTVELTQPVPNTLECPETHPAGAEMCLGVTAGSSVPENNFIFVILSASNVPSVVPGWIEAGLGNMFTDYACGTAHLAECVTECYNIPPSLAGQTFYFQAIVWNYITPSTPVFPTTNLCSTTFY